MWLKKQIAYRVTLILLIIIAIAVCLGIAPFFIDQKGYVLIAFNKTTIEGTIWGVTALLILAFRSAMQPMATS